mgnify:CR=1 FL=1
MYTVGVIGHLIDFTLPLMKILTPFTLLLTGGTVLFFSQKNTDNKMLFWVIITYSITFTLEVIGVKTGLIFGNYSYGKTLGLNLFEVPLIIGFNWVLVVMGAIQLSKKLFNDYFFIALFTGIFAVIFDFFLEPIAIMLDYWSWNGNHVPLHNYIAWFVIAFMFSILFQKMKITINSTLAERYFLTQLTFFIILFLFMR